MKQNFIRSVSEYTEDNLSPISSRILNIQERSIYDNIIYNEEKSKTSNLIADSEIFDEEGTLPLDSQLLKDNFKADKLKDFKEFEERRVSHESVFSNDSTQSRESVISAASIRAENRGHNHMNY